MRLVTPAASAAMLFLTFVAGPAHAAKSYDSCTGTISALPTVISTQGTWCMKADLATGITSGVAISVQANNVIIDCNGFKLGGLAAGAGTTTTGISMQSRLNTTIRDCAIRGFLYGVDGGGGGGHIIEDNRFEANRYAAVLMQSTAGSTIRRNLIVDSGDSTVFVAQAYGMYLDGGVDVLDNTIDGVTAIGNPSALTTGIHLYEGLNSSVTGNRIKGVERQGEGVPYGIRLYLPSNTVVSGNVLQTTPLAGGIGIDCADLNALATDNRGTNFDTFVDGCTDYDNVQN